MARDTRFRPSGFVRRKLATCFGESTVREYERMEYECQAFSTRERDIPISLDATSIYSRIPNGYAQPVSLALNIRRLRRAAELTQTALGDRLGVGQGAVSKWENGETEPDASLLPKLALVVGSTLDDVLQGLSIEYDTGRDLVRHGRDQRSAPLPGGTVDPVAARLLQDRLERNQALADQIQDVIGRLALRSGLRL